MIIKERNFLLTIILIAGIAMSSIIGGIIFFNSTNKRENIHDTTAPLIEIKNPMNTIYNSANQLLNISAIDNVDIDTIWYNWNGINISYTSPIYIIFNEGLNTIKVWANDTEGNIGTTEFLFNIDTINPIIEIENPINAIYHYTTHLMSISALDNKEIDSIWYNWSGMIIPYTNPFYIALNEGLNIIQAWANDTAGNIATTAITVTINFDRTFTSSWDTTLISSGSSSSNQIALPLESTGIYNFTVKWGDGTNDTIISWNQPEVNHIYSLEGEYIIEINGTLIGWRFNNHGDRLKLLEIKQWGCLQLGNSGDYFFGCQNLMITAMDPMNLTETTNLYQTFRSCLNLGDTGIINHWDVSKITNMSLMFWSARSFNNDIGKWNVSSVLDMRGVFGYTDTFNQDIGNWDISSVLYMSLMFYSSDSFNQNIGDWDISSVLDMSMMFYFADSFNQYIGDWDVSNAKELNGMFLGATSFNKSIGNWSVSNVIDMKDMFYGATSFNQDISGWNVSNVRNMERMFDSAYSFNQDIGDWDVSNVIYMSNMFERASSFNQDISGWDVSNVIYMGNMFERAYDFDQDIGSWNVSNVQYMTEMFLLATLSTPNYDSLLIGWLQLTLQTGVTFDAGSSIATGSGVNARNNIVSTYTWTIYDGDGTHT